MRKCEIQARSVKVTVYSEEYDIDWGKGMVVEGS